MMEQQLVYFQMHGPELSGDSLSSPIVWGNVVP